MLIKIQGIVIYKIKFSESSQIVHILTNDLGVKSFIFKGIRSRKSKNQTSVLEYLNIINIVAWSSNSSDFLTVKEFSIEYNYKNISGNIIKSSIFLFISELLHKLIPQNSPDNDLYEFTKKSLIDFDKEQLNSSYFHLWYFTNLSKFLGIMPINNFDNNNKFFDFTKSMFVKRVFDNIYYFSEESSYLLSYFLKYSLNNIDNQLFSINIRNQFLDDLIIYYNYHYSKFKNLNSPVILKTILR